MTNGGTVDTADKNGSMPMQEAVTLQLDNGATMTFAGRQFAGGSWYDEEQAILTKQNLYVTSENEHVYSIVSGKGHSRSRRAYRVGLEDGNVCTINDGHQSMTMDVEMLMLAVSSLVGLDKEDAPTMEAVEDLLRAANS